MGNLVLSVAAIAAIAVIYVNINNKKESINSQISQTKKALAYETNEHKINSTSYAKLNVKPSMLFVTNNTQNKEILGKLAKAVTAEIQSNPNAQNFSCSALAQTGDITLKECEYIQSKHFTTVLPSNQAVNTNTQNYLQNNASNPKQQQTLKIATGIMVNKIAPTQNNAMAIINNASSSKKALHVLNPKNDLISTKKIMYLKKQGLAFSNDMITNSKINKNDVKQILTVNQNHIKHIAQNKVQMDTIEHSSEFRTGINSNLDSFGFSKGIPVNIDDNKEKPNQIPFRGSNSFGFGKW